MFTVRLFFIFDLLAHIILVNFRRLCFEFCGKVDDGRARGLCFWLKDFGFILCVLSRMELLLFCSDLGFGCISFGNFMEGFGMFIIWSYPDSRITTLLLYNSFTNLIHII